MNSKRPLPSTGEMLREEFLTPLAITPYQLAKDTPHAPAVALIALGDSASNIRISGPIGLVIAMLLESGQQGRTV